MPLDNDAPNSAAAAAVQAWVAAGAKNNWRFSLPAKASSSSESIAPKLALSTDWGPGLP